MLGAQPKAVLPSRTGSPIATRTLATRPTVTLTLADLHWAAQATGPDLLCKQRITSRPFE